MKGEAGEDRWKKKVGRWIVEFLFQFPTLALLYETFMRLYQKDAPSASASERVGQNT